MLFKLTEVMDGRAVSRKEHEISEAEDIESLARLRSLQLVSYGDSQYYPSYSIRMITEIDRFTETRLVTAGQWCRGDSIKDSRVLS